MIVAVDTGGTKTLVAVFDTDGRIVSKQKFPTPVAIADYLSELSVVVNELTTGKTISCLSVALPGMIIDGRIAAAGNLGWIGADIGSLLAEKYDCPIHIENDANLAGLAEARSMKEIPRLCLYVTVSTGIGTGVILNGTIDPNYATSEGGHIVLEHDGTLRRWESFASGKALLETYGMLASDITDPEIWKEIASNIAAGLLVHCPIIRPDVIVIGGGVGTHFDKFGPRVLEILRANMKDAYMPDRIIKASHPEEAVIYGCYYHALDTELA